MTISSAAEVSDSERSPLLHNYAGGGVVDYQGRPADRSKTGCWRSAFFIIGVELGERFAYYGISSNLINYLTGSLGQSKARAAENVNTWYGVASVTPLLGAFIADSYLGRYRTILIASLLYILGLSLLTLSAVLPSVSSPDLAVAQGGHKPCVQAFGADQFDGKDSKEGKARSSFFNWWYLGLVGGPEAALIFLNYIQDNLNWGLGFGIPCISMAMALVVFLMGTRTYRYTVKGQEKNPFFRIGKVFANAARNWRTTNSVILNEMEAQGTLRPESSHQYNPPIWVSCLVYAIVFAQPPTFFTEQGTTMDRTIWPGFDIPPASLQLFIGIPIIFLIPIYDRFFVPFARAITGKPSGITVLQRIGIGMFVSIMCMIVAAIVEMKRLEIAMESGLVDKPEATIPMSFWWLVPQYLLIGIADVFTIVGLQEFFYSQVPNELRSAGLSLYLSVMGVGSLLSSFLVSVIDKTTSKEGYDSWFSDNLNLAHLDYFYWLLAGLSIVGLVSFSYFAKSYIYR
ncbi:hypothetical protein Vadar_008766 [Vaccinium darrowii]|uniref:Uncharacterized protein n=1 Tax=Vaccinium darrowii TaxID=229202 RepID=A0ACB7WZ28_9ERIC|nr:hypothetical protein Vadar_008766 [Vaccinium darrowii]